MASGTDEAAFQDTFPHEQLPAEQLGLFRRVLRALGAGQIGFAVAGAFAFQRYTGIWRFTKDLDLFLPAEEIPAALRLCRTAGLLTEVRDPIWLAKAWRGDYYVDFISGMSNGVLWVTPDWIERALHGTLLGVPVRLLQPADILLSKIFVTRRDRFDGSDIAHLIYRRGHEMDWGQLLRITRPFWPMLLWHLVLFHYIYPQARRQVPDWVWRELLRDLRHSLRPATPSPQEFRGMLIDERMFDPDVEQWGLEDLQTVLRHRRLRALRKGEEAA